MRSAKDKERRMSLLLDLLKQKEMEPLEMLVELDMASISAVRNYLREMYEDGEIHISSWRVMPNSIAARYRAGSHPDVEPPAGRCANGRRIGSPAKKLRLNAGKLAYANDPLMAAFYGARKS